MSIWKKIRTDKNIKISEFAKKVGYSVQSIWHFERGDRPMPIKLQIEYLKLRNSDKDKIIIDYLIERLEDKNV